MPDLIITGLPRSGLTVVSALVDSLADAASLNAPWWQTRRAKHTAGGRVPYAKWLAGDFIWQRAQILKGHSILDYRAEDGLPLLDGLYDLRQPKTNDGEIMAVDFRRGGLSRDFLLAMKHHALYTSVLPELVECDHFGIIAVIRHPFDVIASWQRGGGLPIKQGQPPGITEFWPEAISIVESTQDEMDKMVQLYDLFIQRYYELREHIRILKYEDVIASPKIVSDILEREGTPDVGRIETRSSIRMATQTDPIRVSLKKYGIYTRYYYDDI